MRRTGKLKSTCNKRGEEPLREKGSKQVSEAKFFAKLWEEVHLSVKLQQLSSIKRYRIKRPKLLVPKEPTTCGTLFEFLIGGSF